MRCVLAGAAALALAAGAVFAEDLKNPLTESESWTDLKFDVVGDVALRDGGPLFEVEAPYRAHDAATVPILISQTDAAQTIDRATVVIDENPAPVAAEFTFGPAMAPLDMELRVRVNQYSNVRVIAETDAGAFMAGRFVKASGGCSAPATRDPSLALASMGEMQLRHFTPEPQLSRPRREAQIMIRHPNYSGLQRDQITQLFITAHFIDALEVWQGEEMLFTMTGGISISENPVFRFAYTDNGAPDFRIRAHDTDGNVFERILPKTGEI
ncbi:quinoprotein dehydrogenase-associated SoxYZ-like carrier [Poseidonocella sedimentorum]|uniref:Sulfur-oxidizing protein SoxY n=1 Tax=Poseidonocella sedimentorum TaxID=871652 RepID=A0A1I6D3P4_9RHOB|nr:quinoprotein dehydrogenase-associated SoxYZ-like carrier [Poseidonocella sedimentorum]SFR00118.1 sulfur-oxidizing protein SoxY [Poseidonocella sedimentorum]